jgi:hypothetical protein
MDRAAKELLGEIERLAHKIMGNAALGYTQPCGEAAGAILTRIADYHANVKMAEEASAPDRYALATLPRPNHAHDGQDGDEGEAWA